VQWKALAWKLGLADHRLPVPGEYAFDLNYRVFQK